MSLRTSLKKRNMSKSEYVKISDIEKSYGEKNLLQSQLGLASLLKNIKKYHKSRKEELLLKIQLKKKIEEAKDIIRTLEKILPKIKLPEGEETSSVRKRSLTLGDEIREIRQKLAKLQ